MHRARRRLVAGQAIALICIIASPAAADDVMLDFDPGRFAVRYTLGAFLHTVHGTFDLACGAIRFDPSSGKATGDVAVNLESGRSGEAARDRRMKRDILEVSRYPQAIFTSDRIDGRFAHGISVLTLHGRLAVHGASHDVSLPIEINSNDGQFTAHAALRIPYVAWGMKNPSTFFLRVDDFVTLDVDGTLGAPAAGAAPHACRAAG